jgi:predicted  nucleic acid-binding Zn-ribbon protein
MPFLDESQPTGLVPQGFAPSPSTAGPSPFTDLVGAAFTRDNTLGALANTAAQPAMSAPNKAYDPFQNIKGYEEYAHAFIGANSDEDVANVKSRIDQEQRRSDMLGSAGWKGVAADLVAGATDPINLIPLGGEAVRASRAVNIGTTAFRFARTGMLASAAQEAILHGNQETRTGEESAMNIATSTLLAGALGGVGGMLMKPVTQDLAKSVMKAGEIFAYEHGGNVDGFTAYHGSPYAFDAFSNESIGTGEGAQAYGHGLYFAENQSVASLYRASTASGFGLPDGPAKGIATLLAAKGIEAGEAAARQHYASLGAELEPAIAQAKEAVASNSNIYKVRIAGTPEQYIDWDKPLNEQAPAVQTALRGRVDENQPLGAVLSRAFKNERFAGDILGVDSATPEQLSAGLAARGLPGIRYLDHGSRGAVPVNDLRGSVATFSKALLKHPDDAMIARELANAKAQLAEAEKGLTRNFVVFDSKHVTVLDRNGNPVEPAKAMVGQGGSVGAAAAQDTTLAQETFRSALGGEKALAFSSPTMRLGSSPSVEVRRIAQNLADQPLEFRKNLEGIETPVSVESRIRQWQAPLASSLQSLDDSFVKYRMGKDRSFGDVAKIGAGDLLRRGAPEGKMTYDQFSEEVGRAMRRGDQSDIPEVTKAAQSMRAKLFDPLKQRAIDTGLLPEDVSVETALSYLTRVYDVQKIIARRPEFEGILHSWLGDARANVGERLDKMQTGLRQSEGARDQAKEALPLKQAQLKEVGPKAQAAGEGFAKADQQLKALDRSHRQARKRATAAQERLAKFTPSPELEKGDSAIQLVRDMRNGVKPPQSLAQFLRSKGGLKDEGDAIKSTGLKGLVRQEGLNLDDARALAQEAGYLGPVDEPTTINDLVQALHDEPRYSEADREHVEHMNYVQDLVQQAEKAGIDLNRGSPAEIMHRLMNGPAGEESHADIAKIASPSSVREILDTGKVGMRHAILTPDGKLWELKPEFETGGHLVAIDTLMKERGLDGSDNAVFNKFMEDNGFTNVILSNSKDGGQTIGVNLPAGGATEKQASALRQLHATVKRNSADMEGRFVVDRYELDGRDTFVGDVTTDKIPLRSGEVAPQVARFRKGTSGAKAKAREIEFSARQATKEADAIAEKIKPLQEEWDRLKAEHETHGTEARALKAEIGRLETQLRQHTARAEGLAKKIEGERAFGGATDGEIRDIARGITDHLVGLAPGRAPYTPVPLVRGPLKERTLNIPDTHIEGFLESNVNRIARIYTRTMSADTELAKAFGRADMGEQIGPDGKVQQHYGQLRAGVTDEGQLKKLDNKQRKDLRDLSAVRDRIRGTYGLPDNPNGLVNRSYHVVRDLNYLRLLGGMTISAFPDVGSIVKVQGITRVFGDGLVPMLRNFQQFKLSADEVKLSGTALDMVLDTRAMSMAEVLDDFGRWSKFERGIKGMTERFGLVTLMAPWNAAMKQFAGVVAQTRSFEMFDKLAKGESIGKTETARLAGLGINADMAARIDGEFKKFGSTKSGISWANTSAWADTEAADAYRAALSKEVDMMIVTPGQEKPLWMSAGVGKMLGQFRSFTMVSTQKVMLSGLQRRDMAALNGAAMMTGLGMLSYYIKSGISGRATADPTTPEGLAKWVREGVDQSGLLGWIFDANNLAEKLTGNTVGIGRFMGGPSSRYASRGVWSAILGPTAGLVENSLGAVRDAAAGEWTAQDTSAIRQMIPLQNLFYWRWLFNDAERGVNNAMGVPQKQ